MASDGRGYEDGAPPGHTGGFGEPDCTACHSDGEKNAPGGSIEVQGLPASYAPEETYAFAIVLRHPELASGGFQAAVRTAAGEPAGELRPSSERTQVVSEGGQPYLEHTREGTEADTDGRIQWAFEWRAPSTAESLVLNVAANAANDDISELGDYIYTLQEILSPAGARLTGDTGTTAAVAGEAGSRYPAETRWPTQDSVAGSSRKR